MPCPKCSNESVAEMDWSTEIPVSHLKHTLLDPGALQTPDRVSL